MIIEEVQYRKNVKRRSRKRVEGGREKRDSTQKGKEEAEEKR